MLNNVICGCGLTLLTTLIPFTIKAQAVNGGTLSDGRAQNIIQAGVLFLLVPPDSRSAAMGEAGVATSPDANSIHWNPSKLAFIETPTSVSLSYAPWLRSIVSDINLSYLSAYHRISDKNVIGGSLRYFSLGSIQLTDVNGLSQGLYSPYELGIDFAFARQFSDDFSMGIAARYIRSSFSNGLFVNGQQLQPATGFATDLSACYKNPITLFGKTAELSFGMNVSNIGPKVRYTTKGTRYSLPTNLKLGGATSIDIDADSKFTLALDLNKLLVPVTASNNDPNSSVISSIFGSFSDGSNQLRDIFYSLGAEYWLKQQFALRLGYLHEDPTLGSRSYLTTGAGVRYQSFGLDVAYILANPQKNPLGRTLRFTIFFNFGARDKKRVYDKCPDLNKKEL